ncbi:MAG: phosphoglycerate dehydrogenase [Maledivibacter sp.]|jgi:phosphoglycerate dehydrogenase-like enzyme|nr:phosphoglycerate dehydrogenase [Maledivibacter sp.]
MKVLFTYDYGEEKMRSIEKLGYDTIYIDEKQLTNIKEIEDVEVLVCYNPFNTLDISKFKNLKVIMLSSIGIDQAPLEYIREKGIILTNNKGGYSIPISEWIVLKVLEMLKNSRGFYTKQSNQRWQIDTSILELYNKTVGFIGTGTIAKETAKRLKSFEANILGLNTRGKDVEYFDTCYSIKEIDKILSLSDIVVLAIPYTNDTHHLINDTTINMFKDGSYLINVSRGSIIDEGSLIKKINGGKFKGVALDVFEKEPLPKDSPLWNLNNVVVTPHNCWISEMRNKRRFDYLYKNMKRYMNGEELINIVDLDKGY